jgi:hypothetical protein
MELAGANVLNSLVPQEDYFLVWSITIERGMLGRGGVSWPSHNIGRWWDAMLRLEAATGFEIPAQSEAAMLANIKRCLDNPLQINVLLRPQGEMPAGWIDKHSQREIMLALACLVRYRRCEWAAIAGEQMVLALDRFIQANGRWDDNLMQELVRSGGVEIDESKLRPDGEEECELTRSHGRLLEALLEFFSASGSAAALQLADRLAQHHFNVSTRADGCAPESDSLHTHSLLGTWRGLLRYGILTRQRCYVERIARTYESAVRTQVQPSGFISHDWNKQRRGEVASAGDAAQIALWLGTLGYSEYLDDVERIVRARILPSQFTEHLGLQIDTTNKYNVNPMPADDLERRTLGAYGGMIRHPHGEGNPTTDITTALIHTLCDIYQHIVEFTDAGLRINFHLDYQDDRVRVVSRRDTVGHLSVTPQKGVPMFIRIPGWAPLESVAATVDGKPAETSRAGCFLFVARQQDGAQIAVEYELPRHTTEETLDEVTYRLTWQGDDVTGISPNTDFLPFYPTAPT